MNFFDTIAIDDITLNGLEKWTCHMYEQLGWVALANETGNEDKVNSYIITIKKLKNSIESRLKIIISEDAKLDLENILSNVKHLMVITSKLFNKEHNKIKQNGGTKSRISKSSHINELSKLAKKTSKKTSKKNTKIIVKKISK